MPEIRARSNHNPTQRYKKNSFLHQFFLKKVGKCSIYPKKSYKYTNELFAFVTKMLDFDKFAQFCLMACQRNAGTP